MLQIGRLRVVPHFSSGPSKACETQARVKITPREKRRHAVGREKKLKQQRRGRLRKPHFKSEFVLLQTLSRLFHLVQDLQMLAFFLELNSNRLYRSSAKEKESRSLAFTSSTKRENRHFHVVVVQ